MPQGASVHMCVGYLHTGSHTAPHGLSWEIRELEGGDSPNLHTALRIPGMSTWLSGPSVSGSKQLLGPEQDEADHGPLLQEAFCPHPLPFPKSYPDGIPDPSPVSLTSTGAAASTAEPSSNPRPL